MSSTNFTKIIDEVTQGVNLPRSPGAGYDRFRTALHTWGRAMRLLKLTRRSRTAGSGGVFWLYLPTAWIHFGENLAYEYLFARQVFDNGSR